MYVPLCDHFGLTQQILLGWSLFQIRGANPCESFSILRCIRQIMQPGKTYRRACLPGQRMPTATFSQPYITIYVYEKDQLMPKLCIRQINCPGQTQFRHQLVFFIHIYGWLKVAFGIFCLGKTCRRHLLPGGMLHLLQCNVAMLHIAVVLYANI